MNATLERAARLGSVASLVTVSCLCAGCRSAGSGAQQDNAEVVTVEGCVYLGPGSSRYVLEHIDLPSVPKGSAGDASRPVGLGGARAYLQRGSWVRLRSSNVNELRQYVGQLVRVTGHLTETGESTIGTSGSFGAPSATGEPSQAASDKHHSRKYADEAGPIARNSLANGLAPQIAVQRIESAGKPCEGPHPIAPH